tara:strand:+ start:834 stop:1640 length:807 start_codon:yes stop_codon:yes gene_type:complete
MKKIKIFEAEGPIILTQPHGGTFIPSNVLKCYNNIGTSMEDTDWHINKLFNGLLKNATVVQALFSRYLIDPNRDPSGVALYPKLNSTELCPTKNFFGQPIYKKGMHPDKDEIKKRLINFHSVYHKAISQQIERIKEKNGIVLIFDCHSIKSYVPFLFDSRLPDLNFGTNNGTTCDPKIEKITIEFCEKLVGYEHVLNGRFKGGWTIRNYSNLNNSIHSIQLELAQRTYMCESSPYNYNQLKADNLRVHLKKYLNCIENFMIQKRELMF